MIALSARTVELYETMRRSASLGLQSPVARHNGPAVHALLRFLGLFIRYHLADVLIDLAPSPWGRCVRAPRG